MMIRISKVMLGIQDFLTVLACILAALDPQQSGGWGGLGGWVGRGAEEAGMGPRPLNLYNNQYNGEYKRIMPLHYSF